MLEHSSVLGLQCHTTTTWRKHTSWHRCCLRCCFGQNGAAVALRARNICGKDAVRYIAGCVCVCVCVASYAMPLLSYLLQDTAVLQLIHSHVLRILAADCQVASVTASCVLARVCLPAQGTAGNDTSRWIGKSCRLARSTAICRTHET